MASSLGQKSIAPAIWIWKEDAAHRPEGSAAAKNTRIRRVPKDKGKNKRAYDILVFAPPDYLENGGVRPVTLHKGQWYELALPHPDITVPVLGRRQPDIHFYDGTVEDNSEDSSTASGDEDTEQIRHSPVVESGVGEAPPPYYISERTNTSPEPREQDYNPTTTRTPQQQTTMATTSSTTTIQPAMAATTTTGSGGSPPGGNAPLPTLPSAAQQHVSAALQSALR